MVSGVSQDGQAVSDNALESSPAPNALASSAVPSDFAVAPLTLWQKYLYTFERVAGPTAWVGFATRSALDQVWVRPQSWGRGAQPFGISMASHFGDRLVHEDIAFGVRALMHEDPRYFRSGHGTVWQRTRFAVANSFAVHSDSGALMPAYSLFVSSYATPVLVHEWRPGPFTFEREMRAGTIGIGVGVAQSVWREFAPDLKKHLPQRVQRRLSTENPNTVDAAFSHP